MLHRLQSLHHPTKMWRLFSHNDSQHQTDTHFPPPFSPHTPISYVQEVLQQTPLGCDSSIKTSQTFAHAHMPAHTNTQMHNSVNTHIHRWTLTYTHITHKEMGMGGGGGGGGGGIAQKHSLTRTWSDRETDSRCNITCWVCLEPDATTSSPSRDGPRSSCGHRWHTICHHITLRLKVCVELTGQLFQNIQVW